jgi:hypothetical protein
VFPPRRCHRRKLAPSAEAADFLALGQDGALEPQLGLLSLMK